MSRARQGWKFPVENQPDEPKPPQGAIERTDDISS
jgi:hypothetical protein